jgi:hypothetical protein
MHARTLRVLFVAGMLLCDFNGSHRLMTEAFGFWAPLILQMYARVCVYVYVIVVY